MGFAMLKIEIKDSITIEKAKACIVLDGRGRIL
jgi:hypothetical protein